MEKNRKNGEKKKEKKEKTGDYSGHYVIASSRPPEPYINKPRCKHLHAAMKDAVSSITVTRDTVPVKANFLSLVKTTVFTSEF